MTKRIVRFVFVFGVIAAAMTVISCGSAPPANTGSGQIKIINVFGLPQNAQVADLYAFRDAQLMEPDPSAKDVDPNGKPWKDVLRYLVQFRPDVTDGHTIPADGRFALIKLGEDDFKGKPCQAVNTFWIGARVVRGSIASQSLGQRVDAMFQAGGAGCGAVQIGRAVADPTFKESLLPKPLTLVPGAPTPSECDEMWYWENGRWEKDKCPQGWGDKAYQAISTDPSSMTTKDANGKVVPVVHWVILTDTKGLWVTPAYRLGLPNALPMGMPFPSDTYIKPATSSQGQ